MRTGAEYLESLRDGRKVYVGGELVDDITSHPRQDMPRPSPSTTIYISIRKTTT